MITERTKGFTLFELVLTILVLSIISTYVYVKRPSTATYSLSYVTEQLRRDIRYTQILALTLNATYSIVISSNSYTISPNPPKGSYLVTMPSGITLSAMTIAFDQTGAPGSGATVTITGGGSSNQLTILPETGFVNG